MHPDAMLPVLLRIIDSHRIRTLYNANSTTLFYDFARAIRRDRPRVRIVDHLYDHRVGYIEWYRQSDLVDCIDACVAENQPIADTLEADYGWPRDRAPVIWPCGRPPADLPPTAEHAAIRSRLRAELELPADAVVVLVAARMHEQKRPLDLVRLARAVQDLERVHIVVAGGGPLEGAVDRAIAQAPEARIRRLGFRSDVPDLIVAADAGCLVSEFEGLPVFLLECLQLGRPFLGTEVGDLGRVLRDTGAGIVVHEPGDIDGLAAGVRRLADDRERSVLAEAARAAAHRFDPLHCATTCARGARPGASSRTAHDMSLRQLVRGASLRWRTTRPRGTPPSCRCSSGGSFGAPPAWCAIHRRTSLRALWPRPPSASWRLPASVPTAFASPWPDRPRPAGPWMPTTSPKRPISGALTPYRRTCRWFTWNPCSWRRLPPTWARWRQASPRREHSDRSIPAPPAAGPRRPS
jgi:glycosyltransferase involved in cell wall biosynthesis